MTTTSIVLLGVILIYFLFAYVQSKNKKKQVPEHQAAPKEQREETKNDLSQYSYERVALTAVIAAVMGDVSYRIKRVYSIASVDEKKSNWKITGRNESMMRRVFFK